MIYFVTSRAASKSPVSVGSVHAVGDILPPSYSGEQLEPLSTNVHYRTSLLRPDVGTLVPTPNTLQSR